MIFKKLFPVLILLFAIAVTPALAQFEGKIVFTSYDVSTDGQKSRSDEFTMFVTRDRILLQGENRYKVIGSINTEGILVRLDFKDFVFLSDSDATALKISKQDITSMMNMFGQNETKKSAGRKDGLNFEKTGEIRNLLGYRCEKIVFTEDDNPDDFVVAWMTRELEINWGMLAEPWGNTELDVLGDNFHLDIVFNEGYFPLHMEAYESGTLVEITEAREISASNVARAMVQIPSGVKVLSFQDYLFSKMSEN